MGNFIKIQNPQTTNIVGAGLKDLGTCKVRQIAKPIKGKAKIVYTIVFLIFIVFLLYKCWT
jgi:hypothetical protein